MKPHIINTITAIILIAAGLFSYFSNEARPATALIAPALGAILMALTPAMKKENKTVAHIVVVITLLFGITAAVMAMKSKNVEDEAKRTRRIAVFSIMAVTCIGATGLYVQGFIEKRKARKAAEKI